MIETLLATPVIVKVLVSLILILVVNAVCKHLLISVTFGAGALAAWCGYSPGGGLSVAWSRFSSLDNLLLMTVILQVTWLSDQMTRARVMNDLVEAVRLRVSRRAAMAALPAVIGLLPMPGGALFSAPLVDQCDRSGNVSSLLKVRTNYWFRHVWEYWWPLYPGVILALDITGLDVWQFVLLQAPFSLAAIGAGYLFLLRKIEPSSDDEEHAESSNQRPALLPLVSPILVVVVTYTAVKLLAPGMEANSRYIPLIFGIVAAMVFVQIVRPLGGADWRKILFSRKTLIMAILVAAVQIYGAFIEGRLPDDGTLMVTRMRQELYDWGIPTLAMVMILPFVAGLTTGIAIGFVGASLPIVVTLIGDTAPLYEFLGMVSLAYVCGYAGMILSPVHICLIVTNQHFRTRLPSSLAGLVKPTALVVGTAVCYYFIWAGF